MDEKLVVDLLDRISRSFCSSLDAAETIEFMLHTAGEQVTCDAATLFLVAGGGELTATSTWPHGDRLSSVRTFAVGEGIVGWAVERGQVVAVDDAALDSRFAGPPTAHVPRSLLVAPLRAHDRTLGALSLSRRRVAPFSPLEQALLRVLAADAAISLESAGLYQDQERQLAEIRRRSRELEAANARVEEIARLKSDFLAGMSHELRTPLNAILGFSEILQDDELAGSLDEAQRRECLATIHSSGKRLLQMINDVLDLTKIEAGRVTLSYGVFTLADAVAEVQNVTRHRSRGRSQRVVVDIDPPGLSLFGDRNKIKQVLFQLLFNAIVFTPEGREIRIAARRDAAEVVIAVQDQGIGIPPTDLARVFEEFWQGDSPSAHEGQGSGLGLSLARRIVELHGGAITVESTSGAGSSFTVRLPAGPPRQATPREGRILVLEDDGASRDLASMILEGSGYAVDVAADEVDGRHKLQSNPYDLVLMDVQLPGMDGLTLTRAIKADPRTSAIPVVALSARTMRGDEQEAMAAGCAGYITKPIEVAHFAAQVTTYLENARG